MFYKMNMSHIHLCIFCVICLIFISKWDPFRNKSYQRETILKINRYLFTFLKMSSEHYSLAWVHVQCSSFLDLIEKKKKKRRRKKRGNPGTRTHANLHTVGLFKCIVKKKQSKISHFSFCNPTTSVFVIFCEFVSLIQQL